MEPGAGLLLWQETISLILGFFGVGLSVGVIVWLFKRAGNFY